MNDLPESALGLSHLLSQSNFTPAQLVEKALQIYNGDQRALIRGLVHQMKEDQGDVSITARNLLVHLGVSEACCLLVAHLLSSTREKRFGALSFIALQHSVGRGLPALPATLGSAMEAILAAATPSLWSSDEAEVTRAVEAVGWFELQQIGSLLTGVMDTASPKLVLLCMKHLTNTTEANHSLEPAQRLMAQPTFAGPDWSMMELLDFACALVKPLAHRDESVVALTRETLVEFFDRLLAILESQQSSSPSARETERLQFHFDFAIMRVILYRWTLDSVMELRFLERVMRLPGLKHSQSTCLPRYYELSGQLNDYWRETLVADRTLLEVLLGGVRLNLNEGIECGKFLDFMLSNIPKDADANYLESLAETCADAGRLDDAVLSRLPKLSPGLHMRLHWRKHRITPAKAVVELKKAGVLQHPAQGKDKLLKKLKVPPGGPMAWLREVLDLSGVLLFFDSESADMPPDYSVLVDGLGAISGGFVTPGHWKLQPARGAWFSLELQAGGQNLNVRVKDESDWLDWQSVMGAVNEMLAGSGRAERFLHLPADDQCISIVYGHEAAFRLAAGKLGLKLD